MSDQKRQVILSCDSMKPNVNDYYQEHVNPNGDSGRDYENMAKTGQSREGILSQKKTKYQSKTTQNSLESNDGDEGLPDSEKMQEAMMLPQDKEYEVEEILEKRLTSRGLEYLVKWKGWDRKQDKTWEPEVNLEGTGVIIRKFKDSLTKFPKKVQNKQEGLFENGNLKKGDSVRLVNVPKCTGKMKLYSNTLSKDYDAENPDPTYVCVFCHQRPHHMGLGDLFGPYWLKELGKESAEDYNSMAESEKKKRDESFKRDSWLHADCALWVPCVLLGGSGEVEGLGEAVEQTGHLPCAACGARGASVGCTAHGCKLVMP